MGGSGGGRYSGPSSPFLQQQIQRIHEKERARLSKDITEYLQKVLARFNDRDTDKAAQRLKVLKDLLGKDAEIDQLLLGGSVAKHTAVDGLSDIDALVILDREDLRGKSAKTMLNAFYKTLNDRLHRDDVSKIEKGRLAVTITYKDGIEIQLLPALKTGSTISIAASDGVNWNDTNPHIFQRELTRANRRLNQSLIPTIKIIKSIVSSFPNQKQLTGYHIEAMSVDASKGYRGPKTSKALILHVLEHASQRVLTPMKDATGQARTIDAYLGKASSISRRNISQTLLGVRRRLEAAKSIAEWSTIIGEE